MDAPLRVLVADEHPLIRAGLRAALSGAADIQVVGEAPDHGQAYLLSSRLLPDVLLIGVSVPGPPTLRVASRLRSSCPSVRVLVLADREPPDVGALIRAGAAGCLLKTEAARQVVDAVRALGHGVTWFRHSAMSRLGAPGAGTVTERAMQVLRLAAAGHTNARIARELGITERTVRFHMESLFRRLDVDNRMAAVVAARRLGLLSLDDVADGRRVA
jgi:DNA-binding NarL/FixJ family response regulator